MYSNKQKMKLLRELLNPEHAAADLCLLREVDPQSDILKSPLANAARQAEKILYALLNHTTSERIRLNRRRPEEEVKPETPVPDETNKETGNEPPATSGTEAPEQSAGDTQESTAADHPAEQPGKDDVIQDDTETSEEVQEQLEEAQAELEETQTELEEAKTELESAHEELEETKEQLAEEKKSEVIPDPLPKPTFPKDKKKTNTRQSTGKTSSTAASKSRRSSTTTG